MVDLIQALEILISRTPTGALHRLRDPDSMGGRIAALDEGASGSTADREPALASALYRWAILTGYADHNPARRTPRFSGKGRERETYLTPDECRSLVDAAEPSFRPILTVQFRSPDPLISRLRASLLFTSLSPLCIPVIIWTL